MRAHEQVMVGVRLTSTGYDRREAHEQVMVAVRLTPAGSDMGHTWP